MRAAINGNKRTGRPIKLPVEEGRVQIGTQVSPAVKRRLFEAAKRNHRTLSRETELRLEQSFLLEDLLKARLITMAD